jgi:hypothetical protein
VKMMQKLIQLLVRVLITAVVCVVCTFTVMTTFVDMMLDQYQLKSSAFTAPSWGQFISHIEKQAAGIRWFGGGGSPTEVRPVSAAPIAGDRNIDRQSGNEGSGLDPQQQQPKSTIRETPPDDAVAVFGQIGTPKKSDSEANSSPLSIKEEAGHSSSGAAGGPGSAAGSVSESATNPDSFGESGKVVVSSEEFTKKKEQLSNDDKNKIFKLLMTRIPQAEIQNISRMMEDGITASELKDIEQLLQSYLKKEEYSQLLGMIKPE